ncbi:MAG: FliM/FliN family flagellar motor switch protein, partial [Firmicutes bacterium]|nr:FliM/FliN family flagellar motor switch protein [Bacillota bacterium]
MTEEEIRAFLAGLEEERVPVKKVRFPSLDAAAAEQALKTSLHHLENVPVTVTAELGQGRITVRDFLNLREGAVLRLDRVTGDYLDVLVNDQAFAKGEVLVVNDV